MSFHNWNRGQTAGRPAQQPQLVPTRSDTKRLISTSYPRNLTVSITNTGVATISDHQRVYLDKIVDVDGAVVTPAPAGANPDKVGLFYDDQARAGGAVTYQYEKLTGGAGETDQMNYSAENPYRHFVALMTVPAAGTSGAGSGSGGGGGGGIGGPAGGGGYNQV